MDGEDDSELLLDDVVEHDEDQPEGQEPEQPDDDGVEIEVEGEEPVDETPLQKHLREEIRKRDRELAELRKGRQQQTPKDPGPPPGDIDEFDYDTEKRDAALIKWHEERRAYEAAQNESHQQTQAASEKFEKSRIAYQAKAQVLGVKNFQASEDRVKDALGPDYLGWIVQYADEPVKLVAALGQNPHLLDSVADEPDPMIRLKKLLKMETKVTVKRKAPPPPEADTIQRGSASLTSANPDKQLAALEKEANKTGDRTKLIAYKSKLKEKRK